MQAPGSRAWIALLAALNALVALSVDMSLPAQPMLAARFHVSAATAGLTLSLFLAGFAIGQLVVGPLADARGRRSVLLVGLGAFTLSSIACAAAPSMPLLIASRLLAGATGAAAPVIVRAMIRDTQPAASAARLLAGMLAALAIAPMIAPTIGSALIAVIGWRGIFATLALVGAVLWFLSLSSLADTLPVERRVPPSLSRMLRGYGEVLRTPGVALPMAVSCCTFAGQFAYINASPAVIMTGYGVGAQTYAIYFGLTAAALMLGSLGGRRMLAAGRSPASMILVGTSLILTGGTLVAIGTRIDGLGIAGFLVPMILYFLGAGMSGPSASALAMEPVPHLAGTASSIVGFMTTTSGAIAGYATSRIGGSSARMFSIVAAVMGALAFSLAISTAVVRWIRNSRNRGSRTSGTGSAACSGCMSVLQTGHVDARSHVPRGA